MTNEDFQLSQQLINTLRGGTIAAYDQHVATGLVGWIAVIPTLTSTYLGRHWTYEGVRLEVTMDSYDEVQRLEEAQEDFEAGELLMVTRYERHPLASLEEINSFFDLALVQPQHVRAAAFVEFPEDLLDLRPGQYLSRVLEHRHIARVLLTAERMEQTVRIDLDQSTLIGQVERVERMSCQLQVGSSHSFTVSFWALEPRNVWVLKDGSFRHPVFSGVPGDPEELPVWSYAEQRWLTEPLSEGVPDLTGLDRLSVCGAGIRRCGVPSILRHPRPAPPGDRPLRRPLLRAGHDEDCDVGTSDAPAGPDAGPSGAEPVGGRRPGGDRVCVAPGDLPVPGAGGVRDRCGRPVRPIEHVAMAAPARGAGSARRAGHSKTGARALPVESGDRGGSLGVARSGRRG